MPIRASCAYVDAHHLTVAGGNPWNGEAAITLALDALAQDGRTVRATLLAALLGTARRDSAPSAPQGVSVPVLVSVAPPAITVNLDMAGLRETAASRGNAIVRRDANGLITGMDTTGASVADTTRLSG